MSKPKKHSVWVKIRKQNKTTKFDIKNSETKNVWLDKNIVKVK
jgi:hypothetical protein